MALPRAGHADGGGDGALRPGRRIEPVWQLVYSNGVANISAYEAKTHWSRLLALARAGESVTITHRGRPVARLVPVEAPDEGTAALERLRARATRLKTGLAPADLRALIDDGRP